MQHFNDLAKDPLEQHNLYRDSGEAAKASGRLSHKLDLRWRGARIQAVRQFTPNTAEKPIEILLTTYNARVGTRLLLTLGLSVGMNRTDKQKPG